MSSKDKSVWRTARRAILLPSWKIKNCNRNLSKGRYNLRKRKKKIKKEGFKRKLQPSVWWKEPESLVLPFAKSLCGLTMLRLKTWWQVVFDIIILKWSHFLKHNARKMSTLPLARCWMPARDSHGLNEWTLLLREDKRQVVLSTKQVTSSKSTVQRGRACGKDLLWAL